MDFDFSEEELAISDLTRQIFEDKVTHEQLFEYYTELHGLEKRLDEMEEKEPVKATIKEITDKINTWK